VNMMKSIFSKLTGTLLVRKAPGPAPRGFSVAHAVNDLPGGPAVNQLNLQIPVTKKLAEDQAWLHWFMLIICSVVFVAVFCGDVLFDLEASQIGRAQGRQIFMSRDGWNRLDDCAFHHCDFDGTARHQSGGGDERHDPAQTSPSR